jgi:hypothetical protein
MQNKEKKFEVFCGMMYAEYCDDYKTNNNQMTFIEYTKLNHTFLKKEFEKKDGSISTIHTQE